MKKFRSIFSKASTTFYNSSMFFPEEVRDDVVLLYAYVRTVDDLVDGVSPDSDRFDLLENQTMRVLNGKKSPSKIINEFVDLAKRKKFQKKWIEAFFNSMKADLYIHRYSDFKSLRRYMYGSAEVIGLMMAAILELPTESYKYARFQGEAFQLLNIIRDIGDDWEARKRIYIPQKDLEKFGIESFPIEDFQKEQFSALIRFEIERYFKIQKKAEIGYQYIHQKYLLPIKTASDMFLWTALKIRKNPLIVFEKQIKPSPHMVELQFMKNMKEVL